MFQLLSMRSPQGRRRRPLKEIPSAASSGLWPGPCVAVIGRARAARRSARRRRQKQECFWAPFFPPPRRVPNRPYAQSFDGIGAITFICNSCSVTCLTRSDRALRRSCTPIARGPLAGVGRTNDIMHRGRLSGGYWRFYAWRRWSARKWPQLVERWKGSGPTPRRDKLRPQQRNQVQANAIIPRGAMEGLRHEGPIRCRDRDSCRWYWAGGLFGERPIRLLPAAVGTIRYCALRSLSGALWCLGSRHL